MATLFISDLHLSAERPVIGGLFLRFLQEQAPHAEALYILGDLFEAWLGDDAVLPDYQPFIDAMRTLSDAGIPLYVMHGNRDFLMGETFEAMSGATLLADPTVIDLYGTPTLLMHGDLLCTDDIPYQEFRQMVRDPAWQQAFLTKPVQERIAYAQGLREKSREATQEKEETIMDVNPATVEDYLRRYKVDRLIHGHTHRPATHTHNIDGKIVTRIVLPEWYEQGGALVCDATGCRAEPYNAS